MQQFGIINSVSPVGAADRGAWVNKKLGCVMSLSICKHLMESARTGKGEAGKFLRLCFHVYNDAVAMVSYYFFGDAVIESAVQ